MKRIVKKIDVAVSVVFCVVSLAGGGGAGAPGVSTCPASTLTASVRLRMVTALIRRKVFTLWAS
jgi:hypothetical protein